METFNTSFFAKIVDPSDGKHLFTINSSDAFTCRDIAVGWMFRLLYIVSEKSLRRIPIDEKTMRLTDIKISLSTQNYDESLLKEICKHFKVNYVLDTEWDESKKVSLFGNDETIISCWYWLVLASRKPINKMSGTLLERLSKLVNEEDWWHTVEEGWEIDASVDAWKIYLENPLCLSTQEMLFKSTCPIYLMGDKKLIDLNKYEYRDEEEQYYDECDPYGYP